MIFAFREDRSDYSVDSDLQMVQRETRVKITRRRRRTTQKAR